MKKIFTLAAAVLASFSLWAATESHPTSASKDTDVAGTSYTIPGTYIAGAGSAKVGAMPDKGIKFRLNKAAGDLSNAIEFTVNEGYVINAIQLVGITNSDNKAATIGSIYVDGVAWNGTFNGALPAKNAEAASDIQVSGIAAAQSVVFVFSDLGGANQGNICYTVTYEEGSAKQVVSTVETLTGVSANGVAMSADEFANLLLWHNNAGFPNEEFAEAPTFVFYRNTVITYDDESVKEINDSIEVVGIEDAQGDWAASATIGGVEYSVYAGKAVSVTITYMDGETVLGTEIIAEADFAEDYVNYESKPLATFLGWFSDAECTTPVDFNMPVYTDITVYAKFEKAYATSLNIEQIVLDYGKKYDIKSALSAGGYDYKDINELDSLNDEKTARNEPYLGLKIKKQGGYIACNVQAGHTVRVKFGYVAADVKAYANDQEMTLTPVENALEVLEFTAVEETFVKIQTTSDKTVVIKQIMIDEAIQEVTLPEPLPTGINNAEEAVKTVKVIRNGQLFIEKNGVLFNAQGAVVK